MELQFRFPASTEYLQPLQEFGAKLLDLWLPQTSEHVDAQELLLAVQEAVTNVIRHSYENQGGEIEIAFRFSGDEVEIEIRDWGKSFDPKKIPTPDFDNPSPGGYGVFIMQKVTDRMDFRREGDTNIAQLMKRFARNGGNEGGEPS